MDLSGAKIVYLTVKNKLRVIIMVLMMGSVTFDG